MDSALTDPMRVWVSRALPFLYDSPQVAIHRRRTRANPSRQSGRDAGSASAVRSIGLRRQVWHSREEFS